MQGTVSRADLLRVFLRFDLGIAGEVRREIVGGRFPEGLDSVRVEVHEGARVASSRQCASISSRSTTESPRRTWCWNRYHGAHRSRDRTSMAWAGT